MVPCAPTSLALANTALLRGFSFTVLDSAAQSAAHRRASKSVPRMPMVAVTVRNLAASGEFLEISPVTARKPPRSRLITILLSVAASLNLNCWITSSELGRTVMRVPSAILMMAAAPSDVVRRSPSLSTRPLPKVRGVWLLPWAKPAPRANSTSPTVCASTGLDSPSKASSRVGMCDGFTAGL